MKGALRVSLVELATRHSAVALMLLLASAAGAQHLEFAEHAYDFGSLVGGVQASHRFVCRNTGTRTLHILRIRGGCGCTTGRAAATALQPGEAGFVEVMLDTSRLAPGSINKFLAVETTDPRVPREILTITAVVRSPAGREQTPGREETTERPYVPGEVLVRFRRHRRALRAFMPAGELRTIARELGCHAARLVQADANLACLTLPEGMDVRQAVRRLMQHPAVLYAQPNYRYSPREDPPDDPDFDLQWSLLNTGQTVQSVAGTPGSDISMLEAWTIFRGAASGNGAIVAVLDNGVDYTHPELASHMWDGSECVDEHGVYMGDCIHGYDYTGAGDPDPKPSGNHGTHVAGIVAAQADNGIGISGIGQVRIMAVRSGGYTSEEFVKGIYFAKYNGATVINASWGWGASNCESLADKGQVGGDPSLYDAIADFPGLFVVAAGNSSRDHDGVTWFDTADFGHTTPCWQGLPNVISVTSTDSRDRIIHDYGVNVDIAAPGKSIYSTVLSPSFGYKTGTSMASPHVAAVAALVWGFRQNLTVSDLRETLLRYGDCIDNQGRPLSTSGNGFCAPEQAARLNAYRALAGIAMPAVSDLTAFVDAALQEELEDGATVTVNQPVWTWTAPTDRGHLTRFLVSIDDGAVFDGEVTDPVFAAADYNIELDNGAHTFAVIAENDAGSQGLSVSHHLTVAVDVPPPPRIRWTSVPGAVLEGTVLTAILELSEPGTRTASVRYQLVQATTGTTIPGGEGVIAWEAGESGRRELQITIPDDLLDELDETTWLSLSDPVNAQIAGTAVRTVSVIDDDAPPSMLIETAWSDTEAGVLEFSVSLTEPSGKPVAFDYHTEDGSGLAGIDYEATSGHAVILAGGQTVIIGVPILADGEVEGNETVDLVLSDATNVVLRSELRGTGTILDNDAVLAVVPGWNLISLRLALADPTLDAIFGASAQASAWAWDGAHRRLVERTELLPDEGYWLVSDVDRRVVLEGDPMQHATLTASPGWNLIGVWQEVKSKCLTPLPHQVWEWDGRRYRSTTVLVPGRGYWLWVADAAVIRLTPCP